MEVGKSYLVGDGGCYDEVRCLAINPPETPPECYAVLIEYLSSDFCRNKDLSFEHDNHQGYLVVYPM